MVHYRHERNQSAEILRQALEYMGRQPAAFTPPNFAVWYEHLSGVNPPLSHVVNEMLREHRDFTDDVVLRLYARYIVGRDVQEFEHTQGRLRSIVEETVIDVRATRVAVVEYSQTILACISTGPVPDVDALRNLATHTDGVAMMLGEVIERLDSHWQRAVTALKELEQVQSEPQRDPLTRLPTVRALERLFEASRSTSSVEGWCCIAIDVDNFKVINDTYGHVQGDKVLLAVAGILTGGLGPTELAGRVGGEEFLVLLPPGDELRRLSLADHIRREVEQVRVVGGQGVAMTGVVTVSIGVAVGRTDESFEDLRDRADKLMYRAKSSGRNRVVYANES